MMGRWWWRGVTTIGLALSSVAAAPAWAARFLLLRRARRRRRRSMARDDESRFQTRVSTPPHRPDRLPLRSACEDVWA